MDQGRSILLVVMLLSVIGCAESGLSVDSPAGKAGAGPGRGAAATQPMRPRIEKPDKGDNWLADLSPRVQGRLGEGVQLITATRDDSPTLFDGAPKYGLRLRFTKAGRYLARFTRRGPACDDVAVRMVTFHAMPPQTYEQGLAPSETNEFGASAPEVKESEQSSSGNDASPPQMIAFPDVPKQSVRVPVGRTIRFAWRGVAPPAYTSKYQWRLESFQPFDPPKEIKKGVYDMTPVYKPRLDTGVELMKAERDDRIMAADGPASYFMQLKLREPGTYVIGFVKTQQQLPEQGGRSRVAGHNVVAVERRQYRFNVTASQREEEVTTITPDEKRAKPIDVTAGHVVNCDWNGRWGRVVPYPPPKIWHFSYVYRVE